ncbi:MAG TPA: class I SAM-dependent methyltransferase [Lysobacter sp.]
MLARCPCCNSSATLTRELARASIVQQLEAFVKDPGIQDCTIHDYRMFQCDDCRLEFSDPMREPDPGFYEWLTQSHRYYPERRWEWEESIRDLESTNDGTGRKRVVLDVGCGGGQFLKLLESSRKLEGIGVEVSLASASKCRAEGLTVIHGNLATAMTSLPQGVDVVTLWHVVEHVADPIGLLGQAKALLAKNGAIYFSVPLSPPSYEASWTDPLNQPPHHLTRWNVASLKRLSAKLDMSLELLLPAADGYFIRLARALLLQCVSPFESLPRWKKALRLAGSLIAHPSRLFVNALRQHQHPRANGKVLPDLVLVRLQSR